MSNSDTPFSGVAAPACLLSEKGCRNFFNQPFYCRGCSLAADVDPDVLVGLGVAFLAGKALDDGVLAVIQGALQFLVLGQLTVQLRLNAGELMLFGAVLGLTAQQAVDQRNA